MARSTVLTLGPPEAEEQLRDMMAIGVDQAIHLVTDGSEWDPQATAARSSEAIRRAAPSRYDLILFGNESADAGNYQVPIRVATRSGLPCVNGIKGISVQDGRLRCEQEVDGGRDIYLVPTPAVVSVKEGINLPRYPVGARAAAGQAQAAGQPPSRPSPSRSWRWSGSTLPPGTGKQVEILGRGPEAAPAVVGILGELGLL